MPSSISPLSAMPLPMLASGIPPISEWHLSRWCDDVNQAALDEIAAGAESVTADLRASRVVVMVG